MFDPAPSQDRRSPFGATDSPDTSPAADSSSLSGGPSVVRFISADFDAHTCTVRYLGAVHVLTLDYDPGEGGQPYCWGGDDDVCCAANADQQVVNALCEAWRYGGREVG